MLTTDEYKQLETRVAQGRKFLDGKWGNTDRETRQWISLWFQLSDSLFSEAKKRGLFASGKTVTVEDAMAHFDKIKQDAIDKGLIKAPKERRKNNDSPRSKGHSLFATS